MTPTEPQGTSPDSHDIPVRLSLQDADHLLAAVEWALGHDCGSGPNEATLDEFIRPGLRRWAIEEAARKIESVAAMQRRGFSNIASVAAMQRRGFSNIAAESTIIGYVRPPHDQYTGLCPCGCGVEFVDGKQALPDDPSPS